MALFRKKPIVVEAVQWFKNGDHPLDRVGEEEVDPLAGAKYTRKEGAVVRFFRSPEQGKSGSTVHETSSEGPGCGHSFHEHGFIDTFEGRHAVCPGDWIITGVKGERYPCKPDIFVATYDPVA